MANQLLTSNTLNNTITNLRATTAAFQAGQIVDGQPIPVHLAIATTGYRIQSQILRLPDRFGVFSSGPPRLQVYEAALFVDFAYFWPLMIASSLIYVVFCMCIGFPKLGRVVVFVSRMEAVIGAVMLVCTCVSARRAPGYLLVE